MRVVSGIEVTTVSTTAQFPVGEKFSVSQPAAGTQAQEWIYVKAGVLTVVGGVMARAAGSTTCLGVVKSLVDEPSINIVGISQHVIALNSYGFLLCKGVGEVLAGSETIDINVPIIASAAVVGAAMNTTASAGDAWEVSAFGQASENAASTALATCFINCPGA